MQDVSSILLLQECAVKTDSYSGLDFLGIFASYISQIRHVSRLNTNSIGNYNNYQSEKNVFELKELENWVGNPKISCKVKMFYTPGFFSFVSIFFIPFSIFGVFMF
jgi:hypothetical protein